VTVNEVNQAPVLAAISNRVVHSGMLVTFTNSATDPDLPANALTYSLDPGVPSGATIGAVSGVFTWATADADSGTTNDFTVRVTDNGTPPLGDAGDFNVAVLPRPNLQSARISSSEFVLSWDAIPGTKYRLRFKDNVEDLSWTDIVPDIVATSPTMGFTNSLAAGQRFFQLLVVQP